MAVPTYATIHVENGQIGIPINGVKDLGLEFLYHGSCGRCHHFHRAKQLKMPFDPDVHTQFPCEKCGRPLFGAGRTSTHVSLASVLTSSSYNITSGQEARQSRSLRSRLTHWRNPSRINEQDNDSNNLTLPGGGQDNTGGHTDAMENQPITQALNRTDQQPANWAAFKGHNIGTKKNRSILSRNLIRTIFDRFRGALKLSTGIPSRSSPLHGASTSETTANPAANNEATGILHQQGVSGPIVRDPLATAAAKTVSAVQADQRTEHDPLNTTELAVQVENRLLSHRREQTLRTQTIRRLQYGRDGRGSQAGSLPSHTTSNGRKRASHSKDSPEHTSLQSPLASLAAQSINAALLLHPGTHLDPSFRSPSPSSLRLEPVVAIRADNGATTVLPAANPSVVDDELGIIEQRPIGSFRRTHSLPSTSLHDPFIFLANARPEFVYALDTYEPAATSRNESGFANYNEYEGTSSAENGSNRASSNSSAHWMAPMLLNATARFTHWNGTNANRPSIQARRQMFPTDSAISSLHLGVAQTNLPNHVSPSNDIAEES